MKQQTYLLTGGTGFLGSHLLKRLLASGAKVVLLKRSTSSLSRVQKDLERVVSYNLGETPLEKIFSEHRFDAVLHCATDYGRRDVSPTELIEANLILPLTLLQLAVKHGVKGFVNTDTILDKRISHYSLSKRQFFDWLSVFSDQLCCVNVALEHFYGPGDTTSKFVSYIIAEILNEKPSISLTPGLQKRDFIYIDDVIDAFIAILSGATHYQKGLHRFEIGSGSLVEIKSLVQQIQKLAGNTFTELRFGDIPYRKGEIMESHVDLTALKSLGWAPKVSLEEGLRRTIEADRKTK